MYVFALGYYPSPARREDASDVFMHLSVFRIRVTLRLQQGGDYPRQQATTYHTSSGVPGRKLR